MKTPFSQQVPRSVQQTIARALAGVNAGAPEGEHLIAICTLFGPISTEWPYQPLHQRSLLLYLCSLRTFVPLWTQLYPAQDTLHQFLSVCISLIMHRGGEAYAHTVVPQLWQRIEHIPLVHPGSEPLMLSMGTFLKLLDPDDSGTTAPVVHWSVALIFLARAYTAFYAATPQEEPDYVQHFWQIWLTQVVPHMWRAFPTSRSGAR